MRRKKGKRPAAGAGRLTASIRRAVETCGVTRGCLSRVAGIEEASLSRFMRGRTSLTLTSVECLADVLGLEIVQRGPVKLPPTPKRGRPKGKGTNHARR